MERQGPGRWEYTGWGENSSIWKVFSAQPGVPISSPFQFAHFPSNDSLRVITVLFTNEVWKMGARQGLSIAGSAGMHGSVSRRHRKHRSLFLGEAEHEWKVPWAGRWGRYIHHLHLPERLPGQGQVAEAQRGAREMWGPPTLNKCLKTHREWLLYFSPLDPRVPAAGNGGVLVVQEPVLDLPETQGSCLQMCTVSSHGRLWSRC